MHVYMSGKQAYECMKNDRTVPVGADGGRVKEKTRISGSGMSGSVTQRLKVCSHCTGTASIR